MGKWRFPVPTQHTTVHMEGPGLMLFEIDTVFGKFYLYKCMLPVGPFELLCQVCASRGDITLTTRLRVAQAHEMCIRGFVCRRDSDGLVQDTCYAVSSVPSVYTKLLGKIASSALEQDRLVWESKVAIDVCCTCSLA